MAPVQNFAAIPRVGTGLLSAANTNRDGTGTVVTLFAAGANGSRVSRITAKAIGTTTTGMVRVFLYDGTNYRLYAEIPVTAATPSGTVQSFQGSLSNMELDIPSTVSIVASTHNAESFHLTVEAADY